MTSEIPLSRIHVYFSDLFKRYALHLIIFLTALFFIITISNPATFFNDEWITLNQLRQMDQGHQMIYNEGAYGVWKNGTITPYFDVKERYLGYTLMLPVLSYPMLKLFSLFGDNFRFFVIFLWAFLPVLVMVILNQYRPDYTKFLGLPWTWIVFVLMAGLFFFNIILYYPFPFYGDTVPREIAAIVFTQHILFALLCVVVFSIINLYFKDTWCSLFGLIICIGCSSYVFWATNAKDHILTVTFLAIALFFILRYLLNGNYLDGISGFIAIGLLSWARPEFALTMFIFSAVFLILLNLYLFRKKMTYPFSFHVRNLFLPIATILGALPFFINNYYVNKNPFIPTFLLYLTKNDANSLIQNISSTAQPGDEAIVNTISGLITPLLNKVISHFSIKTTDFFNDFLSILTSPKNGAMSILGIAPIAILLGIIILCLIYQEKRQFFLRINIIKLYLLVLLVGLPLTYIGGIHGLNTSLGITPDIRYLSPIYLVISLVSIFLIYDLFPVNNWKKNTLMTTGIIGFSVPINLYMLLIIFTGGGTAPEYIRFYNVFSIVMACLTVIFFLMSRNNETFKDYFFVFLGAIVISPFSWQILLTYFFASAKFNGYPFWLPMMEVIYNKLIFVS